MSAMIYSAGVSGLVEIGVLVSPTSENTVGSSRVMIPFSVFKKPASREANIPGLVHSTVIIPADPLTSDRESRGLARSACWLASFQSWARAAVE